MSYLQEFIAEVERQMGSADNVTIDREVAGQMLELARSIHSRAVAGGKARHPVRTEEERRNARRASARNWARRNRAKPTAK